tara:strand:- start:171 stop:344 length:174 start_codon:yes stop_codon:yes gene_type:complete
MCDLSNDEVFERWQECNRRNAEQGADYWYDFMTKRSKRGGKDADKARATVDRMDKAK